jgi:hypothetical protein
MVRELHFSNPLSCPSSSNGRRPRREIAWQSDLFGRAVGHHDGVERAPRSSDAADLDPLAGSVGQSLRPRSCRQIPGADPPARRRLTGCRNGSLHEPVAVCLGDPDWAADAIGGQRPGIDPVPDVCWLSLSQPLCDLRNRHELFPEPGRTLRSSGRYGGDQLEASDVDAIIVGTADSQRGAARARVAPRDPSGDRRRALRR